MARQVNNVAVGLTPEVIAKRTKRHLDELEVWQDSLHVHWLISFQKSNYAEPSGLNIGDDDEEDGGGKYTKGRARQIISDKRTLKIPGSSPAATKKKSTMNIRTALLYRKNLATLIDESVSWMDSNRLIFNQGISGYCWSARLISCCANISFCISATTYMLCLWLLGKL